MRKFRSSKTKTPKPIRGVKSRIADDLIARFLSHVATSPDHIAIMTSDTSITYQALYHDVLYWKTLLSQHIQGKTIICLERTPRLLAVLLALQWLDITYIPVEPSVPIERLRIIIDDSQATTLLYDIQHPDFTTLACKQLDLLSFERSIIPIDETAHQSAPEQQGLAYVIYTSGSTGKPKGVAISRRALSNFLFSMSRHFLQDEHAMVLAITTISFDIASLELYLPLWNKKTLFLANQNQCNDPLSLLTILNDYPITLLQTTPSMWNLLLAMEWSGKSELVALCGGEPLTQTLAQRLLADVAQLWNMYGPTEATVWCSLKQIQYNEPITIGRPIDNMEMRVMDVSHQILPPYVKGELYIAGLGLADGYINNEHLNQTKFMSCADALNGRLYRVGDIACMTPEGEFIIFGRTDNQIKLHGYRIELEEIEAHIRTSPNILECAVMEYHEQLIAYLCVRDQMHFSEAQLMDHLESNLPIYMLPKRIVLLDQLPRLPNGKIDRTTLPPPELVTTHVTEMRDLTPLQFSLSRIWADELGLYNVGLYDNFFELGGHSLLAARIISKIARQFGKQTTLNDFYHAPTIAQFTEVVEHAHDRPSDVEINKQKLIANRQRLPLNDFQLMLWASWIFEPNVAKLNVAARKRIQGPLNKAALDLSLQLVMQKHEILSYAIPRFYPTQTRHAKKSLQWDETSLMDYTRDGCETYLANAFNTLFYHQTWPLHAPMIVAKLFYLANEQIELHVCMSHLIADDNSTAIFFQDLSNAYLFYAHHAPLRAYETGYFYQHYVLNQQTIMARYAELDAHFWADYLQDTQLFQFPKQYLTCDQSASWRSTHIEIPEVFLSKLRELGIQQNITLSDVLCAAVGLALFRSCEEDKSIPKRILMNVVKSTRDDPTYDHVIGCFLRIYPVKIALNNQETLLSLAKQVQRSGEVTAEHQRASSLVKLASVGQLIPEKKSLKAIMCSSISALLSAMLPKHSFNKTLLNACLTLAAMDRRQSVLININMLTSFFTDSTKPSQPPLFGVPNPEIPLEECPVNLFESTFDVCFHRNNDQNRPFVVISSHLTPAFQERFGQILLEVMQYTFNH